MTLPWTLFSKRPTWMMWSDGQRAGSERLLEEETA